MYLPWKKMMFCRVEKTAFGECLCVHIFSKGKVSFKGGKTKCDKLSYST